LWVVCVIAPFFLEALAVARRNLVSLVLNKVVRQTVFWKIVCRERRIFFGNFDTEFPVIEVAAHRESDSITKFDEVHGKFAGLRCVIADYESFGLEEISANLVDDEMRLVVCCLSVYERFFKSPGLAPVFEFSLFHIMLMLEIL
jgi:hypothetical protein